MLTDRQLLILQVIIDDFIRSAQPVGSRSLSKKNEIQYSSATVRNEMSDLEEMGFIEKTHTSSGRVPSEKGYRFYVDHLLSPQALKQQDISQIHSIFAERIFEMENIVQRSAKILSELTNYTSIVLGPNHHENRVKQIQVVPISEGTAIAIIVTDTGHVESRRFSFPKDIKADDIEKMVRILNERLVGTSLMDMHDRLYKEIAIILKKHIANYDLMLKAFAEIMNIPVHDKLFFGGKMNMLNQPEFSDIEKLRLLMDMIEREENLYKLIRPSDGSGIQVKIGKENEVIAMENCSLITATFPIAGGQKGSLAILGPTRMEYSRVISLLTILSTDLSKALSSLYDKPPES
ncbi:heat-inducible transcriptional repressor HrcA [Jeotgalibacillus proteolyticus]|uniref:Heat-inducible transcription repressor HrcA n=1 Tax=Jeotgalibacillus proteolyticus TaxID=2082395 RepID=A0A2S5GEX3_9BACL|nr:heat-inducible transcriptional repressor HrcA [Jeotgalibacillus proteolyticus]PPA71465.1 heat-inducible transcriptional repressor HrcA [Jeotgalibacillus proteolyticus]